MKNHKSKAKETIRENTPLYIHFNTVGWENARIEILYELEFQSKEQLLQSEKDEIIKHKGNLLCLNRNMPCITADEKKQRDSEYGKQHRLEHKEKEKQRLKEWRKNNPEKYKLQCQRAYENRLLKLQQLNQQSTATHS